jgi:hypothetical protein
VVWKPPFRHPTNEQKELTHMVRFVLAAVASLALAATDAHAQGAGRGRSTASSSLSGWLVLDPGSPAGVGLGFRYLLPLVPEGLLAGQTRGVREELDLEFGADFVHWSYDFTYFDPFYGPLGSWRTDAFSVNAIEGVAGLLWNWWLTPKVALYPKLDLGYRYAWVSSWPGAQYGVGTPSYSEVFVNVAAGAMFKLDSVILRLELG